MFCVRNPTPLPHYVLPCCILNILRYFSEIGRVGFIENVGFTTFLQLTTVLKTLYLH